LISVDTNVLVRFLVRDDQAQAARARRMIDACVVAGDACLVTNLVLCELEWVLESVYHAARADVASAVNALLSTPPFEMEDVTIVERAVRLYSKGKGDLSDYLLGEVGRARGARTTYTFDRGLRKAEGFTLL
jgi:predicted nucleic-acid-binding protein